MRTLRLLRTAFAPWLLLPLTGCLRDVAPTVPSAYRRILADGGVQPIVQLVEDQGGDVQRYVVRVLATRTAVAAYQGTLTFDPAALEVLRALPPEAKAGEMRVVNPEEALQGRVRFLGMAAESFASDEAFTIDVRLRRPGVPNLQVALDVAGSPRGQAIPARALQRSRGVLGRDGEPLQR